ncbi:cation diffusion facilitator family transporter [Tepidimicrobium xylanilyticum]|uniref:Cation diffusion facilitator family transporter n=1 Tax=Tepidimicrobium xylanilyticum TaxID=1123352 RepID=A0A1H2WR79_9FIRM|nr:cation diffusion facilitator family transporter [Tepidimicrobium xylanilyticum]SDW82976.1 cation diffusion facilitator family transporter [Tepidimicrobium xylanilyticum]
MDKNNYKKVQQILFTILLANIMVAALKIIIGSIINSASLVADGFHSLSDGSSNVVGLIGIFFASKPEDEDHPYGHNKYETLAGLFISIMLFFAAGKIILNAVGRFKVPIIPEITLESLMVLIFTLIVNIAVSIIEYRKGEELNSQILISDSKHTKSDIFISLGVLATLICVKLGLPPIIDPMVSLVVAGFIIHAGYEIYKENSDVLLDGVAIDSEEIKKIVMSFEEVKDVHKIRSRGTMNNLNIDLHIMVNSSLDVEKTHKLVHDIEDAIKEKYNKNLQLIAHVEPYEEE